MLYTIIFWGASIVLGLALLAIGEISLKKLGILKPSEEDKKDPLGWGELGAASTIFLTIPLLLIFWTHDKGNDENDSEIPSQETTIQNSTKDQIIVFSDGRSFSTKEINYFKNDMNFVFSSLTNDGYSTKDTLEVSNGFLVFSSYPAVQISNWHTPNANCIGGEPDKSHQYMDRLLLCRAVKDFTAGEGWMGMEKIDFKKGEIYLVQLDGDKKSHFTIIPSKNSTH